MWRLSDMRLLVDCDMRLLVDCFAIKLFYVTKHSPNPEKHDFVDDPLSLKLNFNDKSQIEVHFRCKLQNNP